MSFSDEGIKNHFSMSNKVTNKNNIEIFKKDINKLTYEESISELEKILSNVQDENISLDQIQINYIKGHLLLKHCDELLQFCEQEINEINPEFLELD
ncbi:exodeoxyribonuclease VII small subunit [Prochlorococcus marinus]|uniref:exodeoxyribonuclease VII small subunit n=1 Tax=Prochlorococcus marinus TaxID=1219 RepID=UPI0022B5E06E|nr:exodeoxyribonuclease VII small subunit [Prochlorococcus marinus]